MTNDQPTAGQIFHTNQNNELTNIE